MCRVPASSAGLLMGAPDVGDPQRERRKRHLVPGGTAEALLPVSRSSGRSLGQPAGACEKRRNGVGDREVVRGTKSVGGGQRGRLLWVPFALSRWLGSRHCSGYLCCSWVPNNLSLLGPYSAASPRLPSVSQWLPRCGRRCPEHHRRCREATIRGHGGVKPPPPYAIIQLNFLTLYIPGEG